MLEGANPLIESNRIVKGKASGVLAAVGGKGILRNNEFLLHCRAAVEIRTGADPVVEKNRMAKNFIGILCSDEGKGKLIDNIISDSIAAGEASLMTSELQQYAGTCQERAIPCQHPSFHAVLTRVHPVVPISAPQASTSCRALARRLTAIASGAMLLRQGCSSLVAHSAVYPPLKYRE